MDIQLHKNLLPQILSACALLGYVSEARAQGSYTIFDPPGSMGTYAEAITDEGTIVGYCQLKHHLRHNRHVRVHGFLRTPDGVISTIDVPNSTDTRPVDINVKGEVTGCWDADKFDCHGFVRNLDGVISTFDVPNALVTSPLSINSKGAIAGIYSTADNAIHGFVRSTDGSFTTFDVPGFGYTFANAINGKGIVTGYTESGGSFTSYLRTVDGRLDTFDIAGDGTFAQAINSHGSTAGYYWDGDRTHDFIRAADGTVITFDAHKPPTYPGNYAINAQGAVAGTYRLFSKGSFYSFLRNPDGSITKIEIPSSTGISVTDINLAGVVTGYYRDESKIRHGFVGTP